MKLHPAEIAKEIRQYTFFKTFSDELLLQLSTMIDTADFQVGKYVLNEGQLNSKLYFIRSGAAEVVLANEVVAKLHYPGEVIGEMSVVTEKPAATSIRVSEDLSCFVLDSENFKLMPTKDKDHFLAMLYKLYSIVLSERLVKTNEKARLFEIANRELYQAQVNLEKTGQKNVLVLESDRKQLTLAKLAVGGTGVNLETASSIAEAEELIKAKTYDAILVDENDVAFLESLYQSQVQSKLVLMTDKNISNKFEIFKKVLFADTAFSKDPEDRSFTIRTILTTLTKVLSQDFFGFEKYLSWGVETQVKAVKSSREREKLREEMCTYFKKLGVRSTILERCNTVTEELLMNAIYDAPTDSSGQSLYNHLPRTVAVDLDSHLQSQLKYGSDGVMLAISVTDPFGALTKNMLINYLESCYQGHAGSLNEGKGGAGRGLHQIIENSDLTIFNVKMGIRTEVISLFYVEAHKKEAQPSFHYFFS